MLTEHEVLNRTSLTASLEVQGWQHLDAVLIAAPRNLIFLFF
ncbi:MAG: hypothetical protein Q9P01_20275 [Anaerolineae bacterium]|nr:hypothetical protein [Anaerolineae bacterium]